QSPDARAASRQRSDVASLACVPPVNGGNTRSTRPATAGPRRARPPHPRRTPPMRRLIRSFVPALALALLVPASARAATWELDPAHSTFGFAIRHMMISTVRGQFKTFTGKVTGDP